MDNKKKARKRKLTLSDDWKAKIQASQIMNRLMGHVEGSVELSPTQVNAAKILLGKIVPDLKSTDMQVTGKGGGPVGFSFVVNHVKANRD